MGTSSIGGLVMPSRTRRPPPKLAVSVFNAEEVRAAVGGGAQIIDCEDPKADLGMFEPRVVTDVAYAVRQATVALIPTSANIGIPQVVKRGGTHRTSFRTPYEIEAKAAQEALGLAAAMDVGDGRPNIIKFEVDGLKKSHVRPFVEAVKRAVRNSRQFQNHRVIASCLELNRAEWERRQTDERVIRELLSLNEFHFVSVHSDGRFDLNDYLPTLKVKKLMELAGVSVPFACLNQPSDPAELELPTDDAERLEYWVETFAAAGADGVMIDTPIQAKVGGIPLLAGTLDGAETNPQPRARGTFSIEMLRRFSEDCAYRSVECWLAGSIQADDAAQLAALPDVDVVMCRGAASAQVTRNGRVMSGSRFARRISLPLVANLVAKLREAQQ